MKNKTMLLLGVLVFLLATINMTISYNYEYVNVTATVNVTNAYPVITAIWMEQSIILNAGTTKIINCNMTITEWNGYNTIIGVNATLWDANSTLFNASDDQNNHYTNTSCSESGNDGQYVANWTCSFAVWYFANPSVNWTCNATVIDDFNFTNSNYNTTDFLAYYAINVTSVIDFGQMYVGDTKTNVSANVTNFGNSDINVSVEGFGVTPNDGLAMDCAVRNISIGNLHYNINLSNWTSSTALTGSPVNISNFTVSKRTVGMLWNQTYWHLYIPPAENPFGVCNGIVVFTAWATT